MIQKVLLNLIVALGVIGTLSSCYNENVRSKVTRYDGIERSVALLRESTDESPNTIDILFYGQSIIGGMKSPLLVDSLKKIFPSVKIVHANTAIGGFNISSLYRTIEHDVFQHNPDLIVFHAYSGIKDGTYDSLIRKIRTRMSSDILLLDHHYIWNTNEAQLKSQNNIDSLESIAIEKIAKKYNCGYVNVRQKWRSYLLRHNLRANALIGNTVDSNVHPNEHGNKLLRDIIIEYLLNAPNKIYEPNEDMLRHTIDLNPYERTYREKVFGNLFEIMVDTIQDSFARVMVLIDDRPPSTYRSNYYISRPSVGFKSWMPMIKQVAFGETFPRVETWTMTICNIDRAEKEFDFSIEGSITGFDGRGDSKSDFISNSKRIKIQAHDFYLFDIERIIKLNTPENYEVKFNVMKMALDTPSMVPNRIKYTLFRDFEHRDRKIKLKTIQGKPKLCNLVAYSSYLNDNE